MENNSLAYEPPVRKEDGTAGFAAVIVFFLLGIGQVCQDGITQVTVTLPVVSIVMFLTLLYHFSGQAKVFNEKVEKYNLDYDKRLTSVGDEKLREMVELGAFNEVTKTKILSFLNGSDSKYDL